MKERNNKKNIKLKEEFNPATIQYEPVLPVKKSKTKLKVRLNWKVISILIIIILFLYALFSGWLNLGSIGPFPVSPADWFKP
ncbi:MAG: hypothetical protein WD876_02795 [Candidatus Pacearchaeota archaeon]